MQENEEEWNSFMSRVDHVGEVVKGLASEDRLKNKIALEKAEEILREEKDVNERQVYVKNNRTVINHSALQTPPPDPSTMSQEAFMRSVEIDAKKRSEQRKVDKEIADRHLKIGNDAFRQQNYDKALLNYNKGIDVVRDSCLLYTNRALTYHRLGLNQRSLEDANKALWLYPKSLKGFIYKAQALHCLGQYDESIQVLKEACEIHPNKKSFIEGIQKEWTQGAAYNQDATPKCLKS